MRGHGEVPLTGAQKKLLIEALTAAYPSYQKLAYMLELELDRNLAVLSADGPLDQVILSVIRQAEAQGWTDQLVTGAGFGNPGNPQLRDLILNGRLDNALAVRKAIDDPTGSVQDLFPQAGILGDGVGAELESLVNAAAGFQDVVGFATKLLEQASRVCYIPAVTADGRPSAGSGFLVGPDLVLTNHHVLADVIAGAAPPTSVSCVFDYHAMADGTVRRGTAFGLAESWLEASSPSSAVDVQSFPSGLPSPDELDYAVIRLAGAPGRATMPTDRRRGWADLFDQLPSATPGLPLLIIQHPDQAPMQLAIDTQGVLSVNANNTRLTYGVNTLGGSSGSPCYTFDLALVALHHSGRYASVPCNEGIPISTIARHLHDTGHTARLKY